MRIWSEVKNRYRSNIKYMSHDKKFLFKADGGYTFQPTPEQILLSSLPRTIKWGTHFHWTLNSLDPEKTAKNGILIYLSRNFVIHLFIEFSYQNYVQHLRPPRTFSPVKVDTKMYTMFLNNS